MFFRASRQRGNAVRPFAASRDFCSIVQGLALIFLWGAGANAQPRDESIRIYGDVIRTGSSGPIRDVQVSLIIEGNDQGGLPEEVPTSVSTGKNKTAYLKDLEFASKYVGRRVTPEARHDQLVQTSAQTKLIEKGDFRKEIAVSLNTRENVAYQKNERADKIVRGIIGDRNATLLQDDSRQKLRDALDLFKQAQDLRPSPHYFVKQFESGISIERVSDKLLPDHEFVSWINIESSPNFSRLSDSDRQSIYLRVGRELISLDAKPDNTRYGLLFDLATNKLDQAIILKTSDFEAYQAKAQLQKKYGHPLDAITTLKRYAEANPKAPSERAAKITLTLWLNLVEQITGYPNPASAEEYVKNVRASPGYVELWRDLGVALTNNLAFFSPRLTEESKRLYGAYVRSRTILDIK